MGMSDLNERLNQLEQGALNLLFPRKCPSAIGTSVAGT